MKEPLGIPPACEQIDLSVIIVTWNVSGLLARCLLSVLNEAVPVAGCPGVWRRQRPGLPAISFEILVVDSASSDDTVAMVRREFPHTRLYASDTNLGYTGGNNLGIQESTGRHLLLLNPDTELLGDALGTMVDYMDRHPSVGVIGPQLLWPDGQVQSSRRRFPSLATALVDSTFLQKWFPAHPVLQRYYVLDRSDDAISQVDWVTGACIVVRRLVVEQVGLLDDTFFMYSEELDWQRRIKEKGWEVIYLPAARVVHYEGESSGQVAALTHVRFGRSKVRYFRKHHGRPTGELVRLWLLLSYTYEWLIEAAKWILGHKRALRTQRMRVYAQVLRSRFRS
jgi:N-acetylglucosaminyl-diphospho-decaprenol L-rhamnosyltransferase